MNDSPPTRSALVKKAWLKELRGALGSRNLTPSGTEGYERLGEGYRDRLLLPLKAAGRGETAVSLDFPRLSVTLTAVELLGAGLRGEPVEPNKVTWGVQQDEGAAGAALEAYDRELERRGGGDSPAFAANRRFRDAARAHLSGS